ncbi:MAG: SDR family NAD(P)-dependent oxidoreductase [Pseudomonadota bacterium]
MTDVSGKVAFVTGAGSGIGCEIAAALTRRGARVMLADIDGQAAATAAAALADAASVACDVADPGDMEEAARATIDRFGKIHVLVNNAGVSLPEAVGGIPLQDWRWIIDVNLMGVVHGLETFIPLIRSHGEGGHIVNTASLAGHIAYGRMGPYCATKFGVVGMSEALREDMAPHDIGVSVLCPAYVRTSIHLSAENRPSGQASSMESAAAVAANIEGGIDPADVAEWTVDSITNNRFYVFTHPEWEEEVDARYTRIKADYAAANMHFGRDR